MTLSRVPDGSVVCVCAKEIVIDGPGWRSTERDPAVDRVACQVTPDRHHAPAPAVDATGDLS